MMNDWLSFLCLPTGRTNLADLLWTPRARPFGALCNLDSACSFVVCKLGSCRVHSSAPQFDRSLREGAPLREVPRTLFFLRLDLFSSQQELTSRSSHRFSNVPAIPTCHSWAQGRGKAGRRHSGAGGMIAAGERCSWPRPVLSFPQAQKAVGGWWIVLALLGHSRLLQVG